MYYKNYILYKNEHHAVARENIRILNYQYLYCYHFCKKKSYKNFCSFSSFEMQHSFYSKLLHTFYSKFLYVAGEKMILFLKILQIVT